MEIRNQKCGYGLGTKHLHSKMNICRKYQAWASRASDRYQTNQAKKISEIQTLSRFFSQLAISGKNEPYSRDK